MGVRVIQAVYSQVVADDTAIANELRPGDAAETLASHIYRFLKFAGYEALCNLVDAAFLFHPDDITFPAGR